MRRWQTQSCLRHPNRSEIQPQSELSVLVELYVPLFAPLIFQALLALSPVRVSAALPLVIVLMLAKPLAIGTTVPLKPSTLFALNGVKVKLSDEVYAAKLSVSLPPLPSIEPPKVDADSKGDSVVPRAHDEILRYWRRRGSRGCRRHR